MRYLKICLDWSLFILIRAFLAVLEILPRSAAVRLAYFTISGIRVFAPRFIRAGHTNLAIAFPDLSLNERARILRGSINSLAHNLVDFAKSPTLDLKTAEQIFDYQKAHDCYLKARGQSKATGVIFATLHFGPFELGSQAYALLGSPSAILARGFGNPKLDEWWNRRREQTGNSVFDRRGGYAEIVRQLNQGHNVAVLFDQNVKRNHAIFVPFFGLPAATTKALGYAALRTGAPVVFSVFGYGNSKPYFIHAEPIPAISSFEGDAEAKVHALMLALHAAAESIIRQYPEQWFWIHRRWKTRPQGEQETLYDRTKKGPSS